MRFCGLALGMLVGLLESHVAAASSTEPLRILLLYPGQFSYRAMAATDRATRESLRKALPQQPLQIDSEGVADLRNGGTATEEATFIELLLERYGKAPPDLIVAHAGAVPLVARHRQALWPGTPLIFVNVTPERVRDGEVPSDVPTVFGKIHFEGTFDLALHLQPQARHALVIYGTSPYENYWGPNAMRALEKFRNRVEIKSVVGRSRDELLALAKTLKRDSIVLYITTLSDSAGRSYTSQDVVAAFTAASNAPVYTPYETQFGIGVVGTVASPIADEAKPVGEMARRLLAGEPAASIPNSPAPPSVCMIDWRRVVHWKVDATLIPKNCEIFFRDPSFFQTYRNETVAAAALVLILTLTTGYFLQRRNRQIAEYEASRRSEELVHAGRLASVGQLTASITHEMNQPLTAILSNAEVGVMLSAQEHPPIEEIRQIFQDIRDADVRAASVIGQMRSLLTKRPILLEPLQINEVVSVTLRLLERAANSNGVTILARLGEGLPEIAGDRVHLQQVLLNLVMNSMEAMTTIPSERRHIVVETEVDASQQHVLVSVRDTGLGIAPDRIDKLFEPFYTTKATGMGLGLSLVRTIIEAHDGRIWAESNDPGATFRFTLVRWRTELPPRHPVPA